MVLPQFDSGPPAVKPEPGTDMDTYTPATASESADGCVGKLRVYESGRMVLQYGSITMEVWRVHRDYNRC